MNFRVFAIIVVLHSVQAAVFAESIGRTHDELSRVRSQTTGTVSETITFDRATNITGVATTGGTVTQPPAPASLAVTGLQANQATYTWPDVATETAYRLERRVDPGGTWTAFDLAANSTSFPDQTLAPGTTYRLRLIAINTGGSSTPVETTFTTTDPSSPPSILTQPGIVEVSSGDSATLALSLRGTGPFTIEWYLGPVGDTGNLLQSGPSDTLTLNPVTQNMLLWARVSNAFGSRDTTAMQVLLNSAPAIVIQPEGGAVSTGASLSLSVTAKGTAPLSYQWYYGVSGDDSTPVPEAVDATLNTGAQYGGTAYWVRVTNPFGSVDSAAAAVAIVSPAVITIAFSDPAADGSIVTDADFTVSGTASYRAETAWCRINQAAAWTQCALAQAPGAQPSHWFNTIALLPGLNTIEVYAKDSENNESPVIERTIVYTADDHGNTFLDATQLVSASSGVSGILTAGDLDIFGVPVPGPGMIFAWTEGSTDTIGSLFTNSGAQIQANDNILHPESAAILDANFRIAAPVVAGDYFIRVNGVPGPYQLHTRFIPDGTPLAFSLFQITNPGSVMLGVPTGNDMEYHLEWSDDLGVWTHFDTFTGTGGEVIRVMDNHRAVHPRMSFFRVYSGPQRPE